MFTPHFRALDAAYQLHFYFWLKTHYLKPLLVTADHHALVGNVLEVVCAREQYHLLEAKITPEHLRLLVSLKPDQNVSRVVQMLKGNLSREFGAAFAESLARHDTKTLLARGYFARSAGKANLEAARHYLDSQVSHHGYKGSWTEALEFRNPAFKSPAFSLAHCLCMLDYHVVVSTTQRKSLFDEAVAPGLFNYVMAVGKKRGFVVSIQECVQAILDNTRYWMTKHYSGVLKQTDGWDVWQPSFYAATVGEYSTAQVKQFLGGN
jgi:REP element-mobilizing transposase RayT